MQDKTIYELRVSPITMSNVFNSGHRLRIELSSSNFPRFQRNLNTGGDNFTESEPVIARNRVSHSAKYASRIVIPVIDYVMKEPAIEDSTTSAFTRGGPASLHIA